ncbi:hypothetical protein OH809_10750 [Streptomyces sp. NBC_00873]|uniref:hypothetical protein n=1 Tax=unclassified Streptomyces TaxID=2593676 RepID=UPI003870E730|nr:hypothetical protein OH809_10750 [Streptomyces sp. NBC_00873]WTA46869.1 hypothetical protein OH821_33070 [Streptomyces sp. NBC_00842]
MNVAGHRDKFDRLVALRHRLDPIEDFELWYWTTLTACTNAYNAGVHDAGLTVAEAAFSTIPGMYVVPDADGSWHRELRKLGDVSHVGWPPVDGDKPDDIVLLEHAIHRIEVFRDPCLRGNRRPDAAIVAECDDAFGIVTTVVAQRLKAAA